MARRWLRAALAAALVVAGVGGGCALFVEEPPDRSCDSDAQCFRAQGEVCDLAKKQCVKQSSATEAVDDAVDPLDPLDPLDDEAEAIDLASPAEASP